MKTFMAIANGAGYLGGLLFAIYFSKRLLIIATDKLTDDRVHKNWTKILGAGFAATALIPAIFLATVIGGNSGGGLGGMVNETIGLSKIGIPIDRACCWFNTGSVNNNRYSSRGWALWL